MASAYINLYQGDPTEGGTDGTIVSTGNSFSSPINFELNAEENDRPKVGEFLHRANYGLMIGNFDFDYRDGEISYRIPIFCGRDEFAPPTYEQIDFAVIIGLMMISKYGNSLIKVIFGLAEPEDAVEAAELDD